MFKRIKIRNLVLAFILGVFMSFATIALADSVISGTDNFTIYGYSYGQTTGAESNSSRIFAYSPLVCTNYGSVPTGYMGISSYLYNSSGTCVTNSQWVYNQNYSNSIIATTPNYSYTHGYFYARAYSKCYNGTGYTYRWNYVTPNLYF
jgi:hypothetical protein